MADYGTIGGNLSFSGGGGDYKSAYASALKMNQQNYSNILAGYQNTMTSQQNAQGRISTGYQNLQSNVLGSIAGIDRSQRQDIADTYAKNVGQASQDLINRGLGNSTVQSSVGRGLLYDKTKSDIALTNSTQGLNAQYMSQLGLAGLNYQGQAARDNSMWAGQQLGFMNSVNAAYPDPRTYAMLAQMKGQSGMGGFAGGGGVSAPGQGLKPSMGVGGGGSGGYNTPWNPGAAARAPSAFGGDSPYEINPSAGQFSSGAAGNFGVNPESYNWEYNNGEYGTSPAGQFGGGSMVYPPGQDPYSANDVQGDGAPTDQSEYY